MLFGEYHRLKGNNQASPYMMRFVIRNAYLLGYSTPAFKYAVGVLSI
jgi:hypothetical protein